MPKACTLETHKLFCLFRKRKPSLFVGLFILSPSPQHDHSRCTRTYRIQHFPATLSCCSPAEIVPPALHVISERFATPSAAQQKRLPEKVQASSQTDSDCSNTGEFVGAVLIRSIYREGGVPELRLPATAAWRLLAAFKLSLQRLCVIAMHALTKT